MTATRGLCGVCGLSQVTSDALTCSSCVAARGDCRGRVAELWTSAAGFIWWAYCRACGWRGEEHAVYGRALSQSHAHGWPWPADIMAAAKPTGDRGVMPDGQAG